MLGRPKGDFTLFFWFSATQLARRAIGDISTEVYFMSEPSGGSSCSICSILATPLAKASPLSNREKKARSPNHDEMHVLTIVVKKIVNIGPVNPEIGL